MAECDSLQCPGLGHCSQLGLPRQSECEYPGTLLLVQCQTHQHYYRLFPLLLLDVMLGPTIFAVTLGYSISEKALFVREQHLLTDWEVDVNRLNTDCFLTCEL